MAVICDTNIWISALKFGGRPYELVQLALDGQILIFISQSIIDETIRILRDTSELQSQR